MLKDYNCFDDLNRLLPENFSNWDYINKAQYLEIITFMSGYLLSSQGDRMAMGNSVEIRVPYLDHRIIEYMAGVPSRYKIRGLNEKYLLKKVFLDLLPSEIIYRNKNPYRAPIRNSLLGNQFFNINSILSEKVLKETGIFDASKVGLLLKKADRSANISELDNMALAAIISTQLIVRQFFNQPELKVPEDYIFHTFFDKRDLFK